jgi:hypothetical protein
MKVAHIQLPRGRPMASAPLLLTKLGLGDLDYLIVCPICLWSFLVMNDPLRLLIHVPLREKRDFRRVLVGFNHALCVSQIGEVTTYDLLPSFKSRKGQEYRLVRYLAEQIEQGWTLAVWDVERLWRELEHVVDEIRIDHPKLQPDVDEAWRRVSSAGEEQIIDLKVFEKLPNGHHVATVATRDDIDFDAYPPRRRRRMMAWTRRRSRPASEDFWGVLHTLILKKSEAESAWSTYQRWVRNNRPRPPRPDAI